MPSWIPIEDFTFEGEEYKVGRTRCSAEDAAVKAFPARFVPALSTAFLMRSASPSTKPGALEEREAFDRHELLAEGWTPERTDEFLRNRSESEEVERQRVAAARERIRSAIDDGHVEDGAPTSENAPAPTRTRTAQSPQDKARSDALRAVEQHSKVLSSEAGERIERIIRSDAVGHDAEYLRLVSSEDYERAFSKVTFDPINGRNLLTQDESRALSEVNRISRIRSLSAFGNAGADGGLAVPFTLDPTVLLTSDGQINPLRQLATVRTISGSNTLQLLTSEGVEAHYGAEASEVSDDSPSFDQPEVTVERATAFIPFSFELGGPSGAGGDWADLLGQLRILIADAKDALEADAFLNGAGHASVEPEGLLTGATETVDTAANSGDVAPDDLYKVQESLPARFTPGASWLSTLATANQVRRAYEDTPGQAVSIISEDYSRVLGKPFYELTEVPGDGLTAGDPIAIYGNIQRAFQIVDRVGLSLSVVPHLFGDNKRPTGQSGLLAFWRNSSKVVVPNAVRVLVRKA